MVARIKKSEYILFIVTIAVFMVTVGKYFITQSDINKLSEIVRQKIHTNQVLANASKSKELVKRKKEIRVYDAVISKKNDTWNIDIKNITSNSRITSKKLDFQILESEDKTLEIKTNPVSTHKITVNIEGVDQYYSTKGIIHTDIPFTISQKTFRIYEQEDFLPIFGYHNVLKDNSEIKAPSIEIHESEFKAQVEYATNEMGCQWYTLGEIVTQYIRQEKKSPRDACVMTFDDGRENNYTIALPILQEYGVKATFYVITGRIGTKNYMSWKQVDDLYLNGHEIGSHTATGGSLINTNWYPGEFGYDELRYQLRESKKMLETRGYEPTTFAYPLGEWDEKIVQAIKDVGYLSARDTSKDSSWTDRRPATVSQDDDFLWHMYYHKPENKEPSELAQALHYTSWWQFDEEYRVIRDDNKNIKNVSSVNPTETSFGVVKLSDAGDQITNSFLVSRDNKYTIEIYGTTGHGKPYAPYNQLDRIQVQIDGKFFPVKQGNASSCRLLAEWNYCSYYVKANLHAGKHTLSIKSSRKQVYVDKFRIFREIPAQKKYHLNITEYTENIKKRKR